MGIPKTDGYWLILSLQFQIDQRIKIVFLKQTKHIFDLYLDGEQTATNVNDFEPSPVGNPSQNPHSFWLSVKKNKIQSLNDAYNPGVKITHILLYDLMYFFYQDIPGSRQAQHHSVAGDARRVRSSAAETFFIEKSYPPCGGFHNWAYP